MIPFKAKALLIDLDGTIYHGKHAIKDAGRLIACLKKSGLPYRFVTNNSSTSPDKVAERLREMGIDAEAGDVCTSAQAAAAYVAACKPGAAVHVIGEEGLLDALREAGLHLQSEAPDFVVQGIDRCFTYEKAALAVDRIRGGATYVLTNPDLLLPSDNGFIPGAGSIGAMLSAASGAEPVLIGKPSSILMDYALQQLGCNAEETWVIGDNLATDIAAGKAAGCGTLLVLTGLTTCDNYEVYAQKAGCRPDLICTALDDVINWITGEQAAHAGMPPIREE
ncbi:HAD family hydrolase [Paenibacillus oryzae]|uniref:Acid sugar phosphatase n=1 Tax=Paenibacillus oryzae TaxID=1844972 RepID=A0A1A5YN47_9BACL|nr:HAD family hydrolase [Paenibacillus oryzae]